MSNWRLIGSAPDLESLREMVRKRWSWSEVTFEEQKDGSFTVASGKGPVDGMRVINKGGRFRFEMKVEL